VSKRAAGFAGTTPNSSSLVLRLRFLLGVFGGVAGTKRCQTSILLEFGFCIKLIGS